MRRPRPYRARPFSPLTDPEWAALAPYVRAENTPGRPLRHPRDRIDAIFRICLTNTPWARVVSENTPTSTIHRYFRRWTHAGLWSRLLAASARRRAPRALRALKPWLAAVFRRCHRILGLAAVILARRLRIPRALPGPSWFFPDPALAETLHGIEADALGRREAADLPGILGLCRRILARIARPRPVPRVLVPCG